MSTPARSTALARALAVEKNGLPDDFAAQVAALAEADDARPRWSWNDAALLGAFVAMIGVCVAGWFRYGPGEAGSAEWIELIVRAGASQPSLFIGVAGFAAVQLLTFRRRALT